MSALLIPLLNAVSASGAGSVTTLTGSELYQGGNHMIEVSGTFVGTVEFEGRIETTGAWKSFASLTTPEVVNVPGTFEAIRGNVTAYTSGNITLKCLYPLLYGVDTLLARLTSGRATLLDNLVRLDATISGISATSQIVNLIKQLRAENRSVG